MDDVLSKYHEKEPPREHQEAVRMLLERIRNSKPSDVDESNDEEEEVAPTQQQRQETISMQQAKERRQGIHSSTLGSARKPSIIANYQSQPQLNKNNSSSITTTSGGASKPHCHPSSSTATGKASKQTQAIPSRTIAVQCDLKPSSWRRGINCAGDGSGGQRNGATTIAEYDTSMQASSISSTRYGFYDVSTSMPASSAASSQDDDEDDDDKRQETNGVAAKRPQTAAAVSKRLVEAPTSMSANSSTTSECQLDDSLETTAFDQSHTVGRRRAVDEQRAARTVSAASAGGSVRSRRSLSFAAAKTGAATAATLHQDTGRRNTAATLQRDNRISRATSQQALAAAARRQPADDVHAALPARCNLSSDSEHQQQHHPKRPLTASHSLRATPAKPPRPALAELTMIQGSTPTNHTRSQTLRRLPAVDAAGWLRHHISGQKPMNEANSYATLDKGWRARQRQAAADADDDEQATSSRLARHSSRRQLAADADSLGRRPLLIAADMQQLERQKQRLSQAGKTAAGELAPQATAMSQSALSLPAGDRLASGSRHRWRDGTTTRASSSNSESDLSASRLFEPADARASGELNSVGMYTTPRVQRKFCYDTRRDDDDDDYSSGADAKARRGVLMHRTTSATHRRRESDDSESSPLTKTWRSPSHATLNTSTAFASSKPKKHSLSSGNQTTASSSGTEFDQSPLHQRWQARANNTTEIAVDDCDCDFGRGGGGADTDDYFIRLRGHSKRTPAAVEHRLAYELSGDPCGRSLDEAASGSRRLLLPARADVELDPCSKLNQSGLPAVGAVSSARRQRLDAHRQQSAAVLSSSSSSSVETHQHRRPVAGRAMSQQSLVRPTMTQHASLGRRRRCVRANGVGSSSLSSDLGGSSLSLMAVGSRRMPLRARYENAHTRLPVVMYIPQAPARSTLSIDRDYDDGDDDNHSHSHSHNSSGSKRREALSSTLHKSYSKLRLRSSSKSRKSTSKSRNGSDSEGSSMLRTLAKPRKSIANQSMRSATSGRLASRQQYHHHNNYTTSRQYSDDDLDKAENLDGVGQLATEVDSYRFRRRNSMHKNSKLNWLERLRQKVVAR